MNYLTNGNKKECCGCEACIQICPRKCLKMETDVEGFRYPVKDNSKCINCRLCEKVCPHNNIEFHCNDIQSAYGGYHTDKNVLEESTSGGAFSAICETFCDSNFVIFGAKTVGLQVYHDFIENLDELNLFRQSKYMQSHIGPYLVEKL